MVKSCRAFISLVLVIATFIIIPNSSKTVSITPNSNEDATTAIVELMDDPRGVNEITAANQWKLYQSYETGEILFDWGLVATEKQGFLSGRKSVVTFTLDGECAGNHECDGVFGFNIDGQYVAYMIDFDGGLRVNIDPVPVSKKWGLFGYPACGSSSIQMGVDVSTLLSAPSGTYPKQRIRDSLAGGSSLNWDLITTNRNDRTLVTFQLTNDVTSNTFTVNFESASTSFTCVYNTAVPTGKPVEMFFSPDELYTETFLVSSIKVENSRCTSDDDCPDDLVCCKGTPRYCHDRSLLPQAQSILEPSVPETKETGFNNDKNVYGYILLIGLIAFILINNVFVGCWCVATTKSNLQYEKCEIDVVNQ